MPYRRHQLRNSFEQTYHNTIHFLIIIGDTNDISIIPRNFDWTHYQNKIQIIGDVDYIKIDTLYDNATLEHHIQFSL